MRHVNQDDARGFQLADQLGQRRRGHQPFAGQGARSFRAAIVADHAPAFFDGLKSQVPAHPAQTDDAELFLVFLLCCCVAHASFLY